MTNNEQIIKAFAESFSPALVYCRTERINNIRVADAWTCSHWDASTGFGVMATVCNGQIRAFFEGAGKGPSAAAYYGAAMAEAFGSLTPKPEGECRV